MIKYTYYILILVKLRIYQYSLGFQQWNKKRDNENQLHYLKMYMSEYVQIRDSQTMGKGIYAKSDLPSNFSILRIEQKKLITYNRLYEHKFYNRIIGITNDRKAEFAYFLSAISVTSQDSIFDDRIIRQYLKFLPKTFNNLICWEPEELKLLQNPVLQNAMIQKIKKIKQNYELIDKRMTEDIQNESIKSLYEFYLSLEINRKKNQQIQKKQQEELSNQQQQKVQQYKAQQCHNSQRKKKGRIYRNRTITSVFLKQPIPSISFQIFLKYYAAIESRNIYYITSFDPHSDVGALACYIQFINYSSNPNCEVTKSKGCFEVKLIRRVRENQQIFVDYGCQFIDQLLEKYGFIDFEDERPYRNSKNYIAQKYLNYKKKNVGNKIKEQFI